MSLPADPIIRRLLSIALLAWLAGALVIALAMIGALDSFDLVVNALAVGPAREHPVVAALLRAFTAIGDWEARLAIAGAFFLYLAMRRFGRAASYVLYTTLGMWALNAWVLKPLFGRARPAMAGELVGVATSFALPSGHAGNAAAVATAIALVAGTIWWRRRQRRTIFAVAVLIVLGVGVSRVMLGVHWASDVVAGWCVGLAFALTMAVLIRPVQAPKGLTPEP